MGVAFTSGLDHVVHSVSSTRAFRSNTNCVRSICTVADQERKKLGVLKTDAQLFGGFSMATQGMVEESRIVTELKKQYNVVEVDPTEPDHRSLRRALRRAALWPVAGGDGEFRECREIGPADGHF